MCYVYEFQVSIQGIWFLSLETARGKNQKQSNPSKKLHDQITNEFLLYVGLL